MHKQGGSNMDTINKILDLLKQQNKSQRDLTDFLKLDKSTFSQWKNGKSKSYMKYINQIAKFFDVSVDYLFCVEEKGKNTNVINTGDINGNNNANMNISSLSHISSSEIELDEMENVLLETFRTFKPTEKVKILCDLVKEAEKKSLFDNSDVK